MIGSNMLPAAATGQNNTDLGGIWIGIDLGTSNSACAVWDSTRGSPKWVRLKGIARVEGSKWGRLVPSVARFPSAGGDSLVGAAALNESTGTLASSTKRLLGRRLSELDPKWIASLPYPVVEDEKGELKLELRSFDSDDEARFVSPVEALAAILKGIRIGAQEYLDRYALRKQLEVPGNGVIQNAIVGVPAHFSKRQIALVEDAARLAGFSGRVGTCMEATAAAMAYGLTLQETSKDATIMVVDMGGGTTDITIASRKRQRSTTEPSSTDDDNEEDASSSYRVLATLGDERLGGDDIDRAMMEYCINQARKQGDEILSSISSSHDGYARLLRLCRDAKERLCDLESPSEAEMILLDNGNESEQNKREGKRHTCEVEINQATFQSILQPWLAKARDLIQSAIEDFQQEGMGATSGNRPQTQTGISEVILVGGTTRVPAIRSMIQTEFFPGLELGTSLNPMSSVAQGLAIQAALLSKKVPRHELRSALMLDCIPHSIGVFVPSGNNIGGEVDYANGHFVEILKRNAPLPAQGSATFGLADKLQPGITLHAVEKVGDALYEPMAKEPFTFLLRRISEEAFRSIDSRTVEVGMKVDTEGRFIVSIFDELDPEQVRKRERYYQQRENSDADQTHGELGFISDLVFAESGFTSEQLMLLVMLVAIVALYISVKLAFGEDQLVLGEDPAASPASLEL